MLYLYRRVAYGRSRNADAAAMPDLSKRELAILAPIAGAVLWMGVYPESFMAPMRRDVGVVLARLDRANFQGDAQIARRAASKPAVVHAAAGEAH
jgi:NADH-quinone oxidoreductase subunit M